MISNTPQSFKPGSKNVNYLSRDFGQLKQSLINFSKTYYPTTYQDFSAGSPGMMYMEMAAMVGDVMSYYIDYQFKESLLVNSEERQNIIDNASSLGYMPKVTAPSVTTLDVYQLIPATQDATGSIIPDMSYAQVIMPGMGTVSDTGIGFLTNASVDFTVDVNDNPLEISVYQRNSAGQPEFYVLKKRAQAFSGQLITTTINVGAATSYFQINLPDNNIIQVFDVYDTNGNRWYETDYLAQDLVPIQIQNTYQNDMALSAYQSSVPSLLQYIRTSFRFVTGVNSDNTTYLQFGSGTSVSPDEIIIPNVYTVGNVDTFQSENVAYDPSNFLSSRASGQAPANTSLTIRYITGGGVTSNVNSNSIKNTTTVEFFGDITELPLAQQNLTNVVRQSVRVNNPKPAVGGMDAETNDQIRYNAIAYNGAQSRAVTQNDYTVRTYAMPAINGAIAKAYAVSDSQLDTANVQATPTSGTPGTSTQNINGFTSNQNNPFKINLYLLCYDNAQRLTATNPAIRQNLINYLNQYRMMTDSVNLLDGYIINVGVNFSIIAYKNYNKREVLANCITLVQNYFDINNAQFCQPINLSRLQLEIAKIDGVQSVTSLEINNLTINDGDYSPYQYDIAAATVNNIVYPSIDPSVFEVRFPTQDIIGRVS